MAAAAAVLAVAAATGFFFGRSAKPVLRAAEAVSLSLDAEEADPLTRFQTEREQLRARHTAQLNDIIHGDDPDGELVRQAQRQLLDLMRHSEQELSIEGILHARGFDGAVVTISSDSANVLLRTDTVTQAQSAVILELVMRETGLSGGSVKIIPVN